MAQLTGGPRVSELVAAGVDDEPLPARRARRSPGKEEVVPWMGG